MEPNVLRSPSMELGLLDIVPFHGLLKMKGHSIEVTEYSCLFLCSVSKSPLMESVTRICVYHNPLMVAKQKQDFKEVETYVTQTRLKVSYMDMCLSIRIGNN